jgi:hypothetical protein
VNVDNYIAAAAATEAVAATWLCNARATGKESRLSLRAFDISLGHPW